MRLFPHGDFARRVVQLGREVHADLIVAPELEAQGSDDDLKTFAEQILGESQCPVLTANHLAIFTRDAFRAGTEKEEAVSIP